MIITSIQQQKRNTERVNVFIDDNFYCSITKYQLIEEGLYKGLAISQEILDRLKRLSNLGKNIERVINLIYRRPRSKKEVDTYLKYKRKLEDSEIDVILKKLEDQNYINDNKFTEWYIEQRLSSGKYGRNKIQAELIKKGIDEKIIKFNMNKMLDTDAQAESVDVLINKIAPKIKSTNKYDFKNKLIKRILSRGFNLDLVISRVTKFQDEKI